ncbi:MAG: hypothetical protein IKS19_03000 [Clostridia bacterium]|nr:hypothetical protein [Clostridia bacterium]
MKKHNGKLIAPIVIAVICLLYLAGFIVACIVMEMPLFVKILGGLITVALVGVVIYVLIERIKEIRSGIEDDLGKY